MTYRTLIDVEAAAARIRDPHWVVMDCRFSLADPGAGIQAYRTGHLPGARYADLERDLSAPVTAATGRHPLPDPAVLARRLGDWGVGPGVQVVVYDDVGGSFAARLWWSLRWLGHAAVAVLDGGIDAWRAAGYELTREEPSVTPALFEPRVSEAVADADSVARAPQAGDVLIDGRSGERFRGEQEPIDPVAGRIPGAVNAPTDGNLGPDGRFLAPEVLRQRFLTLLSGAAAGAAIHYCGSGVTACHNLLAMEHAGLHGSRLYPGSYSEWIRDPSRPVARG